MANYDWSKLQQYMKNSSRKMERVVFESLTDINTSITDTTPVDTGFAKGSWTTSINKMEAITPVEPDPSGRESIQRTKDEMKKFKLGDTVYHLSNLVYMPRLEYGTYGTGEGATNRTTRDGFSIQAPNGMVRTSIDNFERNLERALKE